MMYFSKLGEKIYDEIKLSEQALSELVLHAVLKQSPAAKGKVGTGSHRTPRKCLHSGKEIFQHLKLLKPHQLNGSYAPSWPGSLKLRLYTHTQHYHMTECLSAKGLRHSRIRLGKNNNNNKKGYAWESAPITPLRHLDFRFL